MAEKLISFTLYKTFLVGLKYIPFVIGSMSFVCVICGCLGIQLGLFTLISGIGIIPTLFWVLSSFTFKCCIWHRLPLYYCWCNHIISWIDFRWSIPINNLQMILVYSLLAIVFILMGMYFKNRYNVKQRVNKE